MSFAVFPETLELGHGYTISTSIFFSLFLFLCSSKSALCFSASLSVRAEQVKTDLADTKREIARRYARADNLTPLIQAAGGKSIFVSFKQLGRRRF